MPKRCPLLSTPMWTARTTKGNLVWADAVGATARVLEAIAEHVRILNWSPDCRYLSGAIGRITEAAEGSYVGWENPRKFLKVPPVVWHRATHTILPIEPEQRVSDEYRTIKSIGLSIVIGFEHWSASRRISQHPLTGISICVLGRRHPVTFSWDNRYLILGYDALCVWDIRNLPAPERPCC